MCLLLLCSLPQGDKCGAALSAVPCSELTRGGVACSGAAELLEGQLMIKVDMTSGTAIVVADDSEATKGLEVESLIFL